MAESSNGRLPNDADEPREPFPEEEPLSEQLAEAMGMVCSCLIVVESGNFDADSKMSRELFRSSLARLEKAVIRANRVYTAEMRKYHKRRGEHMGLPV